jgi:hypothetical protein
MSQQLLRWHIPPEARYQSSSSSYRKRKRKNPLLIERVSPDPDLSTACEVTVQGQGFAIFFEFYFLPGNQGVDCLLSQKHAENDKALYRRITLRPTVLDHLSFINSSCSVPHQSKSNPSRRDQRQHHHPISHPHKLPLHSSSPSDRSCSKKASHAHIIIESKRKQAESPTIRFNWFSPLRLLGLKLPR